MLTLTVSGSVSDFDDTSALQTAIAALAGVDRSLVSVSVTAASVLVTATVAVPTSTTAAAVQTALSSNLDTARPQPNPTRNPALRASSLQPPALTLTR